MVEPERLNGYIPEDEPLIGVYSAELTDYSYVYREPVVVGVTDRRLVSLSDADGFTSIPYEHVSWIRTGQTTNFAYGGNDYRLLIAGGLSLAGAGFVAVALLSSRLLVTISFALAVAGGSVLYHGHRGKDVVLPGRIGANGDRDGTTAAERQWLLAGGSLLTLVGISGIILFEPSIFAAVLTLFASILTIAGIRIVDYAWRHRSDLDGIEVGRTTRKVVRIGTGPEKTVSLMIDPAENLDQVLSRVVYTGGPDARSESPPTELARES